MAWLRTVLWMQLGSNDAWLSEVFVVWRLMVLVGCMMWMWELGGGLREMGVVSWAEGAEGTRHGDICSLEFSHSTLSTSRQSSPLLAPCQKTKTPSDIHLQSQNFGFLMSVHSFTDFSNPPFSTSSHSYLTLFICASVRGFPCFCFLRMLEVC